MTRDTRACFVTPTIQSLSQNDARKTNARNSDRRFIPRLKLEAVTDHHYPHLSAACVCACMCYRVCLYFKLVFINECSPPDGCVCGVCGVNSPLVRIAENGQRRRRCYTTPLTRQISHVVEVLPSVRPLQFQASGSSCCDLGLGDAGSYRTSSRIYRRRPIVFGAWLQVDRRHQFHACQNEAHPLLAFGGLQPAIWASSCSFSSDSASIPFLDTSMSFSMLKFG